MKRAASQAPAVQVIARAAAMLHALAKEPAGMTLSAMVSATGLPKSTVYRLMVALERAQLVDSADGRFHLSELFGTPWLSDAEHMRRRARPLMERLAAQARETVDLSTLSGEHVIFIDQVRWMQTLSAGSPLGGLQPANASASGKALLAAKFLRDGMVPETLESVTPRTTVDVAELMTSLREISATGISVDREGLHLGVCGIATWVDTNDGGAVALGFPVPTIRFEERVDELRAILLDARPELARRLSGTEGSVRRSAETPGAADPTRRR